MLRYFQIKFFPNITTLFYRSQLHAPVYVRNTGWGFEKGKYLRNNYYTKLHWFDNCSDEDFKTSEAQVWMGVKIPRLRYLDPHPVFLTDCAISYQGGGQDTQAI